MMKEIKIFLVLSFLIFASEIYAQNSITGTIRDIKTQETLPNVTIYISDLKTGAVTNIDGKYSITNIRSGAYLLQISLVGYKTIVQRYAIGSDTILDFTLEESPTELNQIVVTAVTHATELKLSPVIIKPVDITSINQSSSTNLIDALKNIPGVNQITSGVGISKPTIRGLGYNRVISLYNGIRQEGQQWGDEHGIEIDEYAVERIEIVKGPGSLLYGSDGIAGVLNFLAASAPPPGEITTQLISNYQSNNDLLGYSISNAGNKNGFQWSGRFSNKYAGNYQNRYDGLVLNSGFKEYAGNIFVGVNKNWGYSNVHLSTFNTTLNIIEGERDSLGNFIFLSPVGEDSVEEISATDDDLKGYAIGFPHQVVNHFRALINNYFILHAVTIHFDLGYQNNKRKEFGDVLHPDNPELYFDLNTLNYNLRYNFNASQGWSTSIGIGGMRQTNTNKGEEYIIPDYTFSDIGLFVFTQKNIQNKWTLAGGLRFDNRSVKGDELILDSLGIPVNENGMGTEIKFAAIQKSYNNISGSVGASYQLDNTSTIKFNFSRGFRAPNIAEIASNGQHEGTLRYEYGSVYLASEISHQIDLAYFLNADHITIEFTPFINFISNYIYSEKLNSVFGGDSIPDPENPSPAYIFTQGNAQLIGGEIFVDIHPHPFDWLHIENAFSFVQATQADQSDSTKYLPLIPAPKYSGVLRAQFKQVGKNISNTYIKFGVDYNFKQNKYFSAFGTETETPAYTLLSAGIGADIQMFAQLDFMSVFISAENLSNVAYQSHLSRLKYAPENTATGRTGVYNMGRNFSVKLIFNI